MSKKHFIICLLALGLCAMPSFAQSRGGGGGRGAAERQREERRSAVAGQEREQERVRQHRQGAVCRRQHARHSGGGRP